MSPASCSSLSGLRRGVQYSTRMSKPRARRAVALPIRPPPPISPMVLPWTIDPSRCRDCPPGNFPARTSRSPSTMRRAAASISPKVRSAVASVVTGGTTVTGMPRLVASATSMLDGEMDCAATWRSFGLAAITALSILSCSRQNRMSAFLTAATSVLWGMMRMSSGNTFTLPKARSRLSALSATGWVTKTRGKLVNLPLTAATARRRKRRRPRIARRREWRGWRRAHRAPWECRARAPATPNARWSRRAPPPRRRPAAGCG